MAELSATTKNENLMISAYWLEFYIKKFGKDVYA